MKANDKIGQTYGLLKVINFSHKIFRSSRQGYYNFWECLCTCGNKTIVLSENLKNGNTKSCGCQSSRLTFKDRITKHNQSNTKTYNSWRAMKDRCYSKNHIEYKRYGGKGITVCDRWINSYENFLKDMGEKPLGMSLDRINSKKNYEPKNCKWSSIKEQQNNKSTNVFIKFNGQSLTISQWADKFNMPSSRLRARIKRGWNFKDAITKGKMYG